VTPFREALRNSLVRKALLNLEGKDIGDRLFEKKQERDDAAAGPQVRDHVSALDGHELSKKYGIYGKPVTLGD